MTHEQDNRREPHNHRAGQNAPVLDIGGDVGALVLYTGPELAGREIEVAPTTAPERRTHTEVLSRSWLGKTRYAAVYAELPRGDYRVWDGDSPRDDVTIVGGQVAEVDWR